MREQFLDGERAPGITPGEEFFDALCNEFDEAAVNYTQRCFYLRAWQKCHGSYPYKIGYTRLKCIMALEEEIGLKQAEQSYKMHQEQENSKRDLARQQRSASSSSRGAGSRNRF